MVNKTAQKSDNVTADSTKNNRIDKQQHTDSGLLIIDKPQGVTSHDIVAAVRSALHTKRVGHAGTLDPMATGVLVIGFGNATRLLNIIVEHNKTYEATIRLGQRTTTDDADGDLLPSDGTNTGAAVMDTDNGLSSLTSEQAQHRIVEAIKQHFLGNIEQVPSTYSAIKIHGQRAYDLAREGKDVELTARPVRIDAFDVLDVRCGNASTTTAGLPLGERTNSEQTTPVIDVDVRVTCSAGTYIRALARDLGKELGIGGYLTRLRRTRVGGYCVDDPHVVNAHQKMRSYTNRQGDTVTRAKAVLDVSADELNAAILPMIDAVATSLPMLAIGEKQAQDLRFGRRIRAEMSALVLPNQLLQSPQQQTEHQITEQQRSVQQTPAEHPAQRKAARQLSAHQATMQQITDCKATTTTTTANTKIAACVLETRDVVAIVTPCGGGAVKPVTVFPASATVA